MCCLFCISYDIFQLLCELWKRKIHFIYKWRHWVKLKFSSDATAPSTCKLMFACLNRCVSCVSMYILWNHSLNIQISCIAQTRITEKKEMGRDSLLYKAQLLHYYVKKENILQVHIISLHGIYCVKK